MSSINVLMLASITIAFSHTVIGVDHYLPFIMIGKARKWSKKKVLLITGLCGIGHVVGSIILGFTGIALGSALGKLEQIESVRGSFAAWTLVCFGMIYAAWGMFQIMRGKSHTHEHIHEDGLIHHHEHNHQDKQHHHIHEKTDVKNSQQNQTIWTLFIIFVLGPCEPLIPILMYPAWEKNWWGLVLVTFSFSVVTITTMLLMVFAGMFLFDTSKLKNHFINKYANVIAGLTIAISGLAIQLLGI